MWLKQKICCVRIERIEMKKVGEYEDSFKEKDWILIIIISSYVSRDWHSWPMNLSEARAQAR